ncbi:hypothetical protein B4144_1576 [Bacillus atrophaeus]|nr:hypothetical protein B4144_1576 [Bacillus atrophaeus]
MNDESFPDEVKQDSEPYPIKKGQSFLPALAFFYKLIVRLF